MNLFFKGTNQIDGVGSKKNNSFLFVLLLTLLVSFSVFIPTHVIFAGNIKAQVDTRKIEEGGEIVLTVTIMGSLDDEFNLPALDSFDIEQSAHSTSHSWINGKSDSKEIYSFTISPKSVGTLTIPALSVKVDGEVKSSSPIAIEVVPAGQASDGQNGEERIFFIEREFGKKTLYVGESTIAKILLYTRQDILEGKATLNLPSEFKVTEIEGNRKYEKDLDGMSYTVYEVAYIVEVTKQGTYSLPPARMDILALAPNQNRPSTRQFDPFQFFGGGSMGRQKVKKRLLSAKDSLLVKEVPLANAPQDYIPIIGQFSLSGGLQPRNIEAQKTAVLSINLEGWGKLDGILLPQIAALKDIKTYADKPTYENSQESGGNFAKASFAYSLVPLVPGTYHLGTYAFSYFNTLSESFEKLSLDFGDLIVTASAGSSASNSQSTGSLAGGWGKENVADKMALKTMFFNYDNDQILRDERLNLKYVLLSLGFLGGWGVFLVVWTYFAWFKKRFRSKTDDVFDFEAAKKLWSKNRRQYHEARLGGQPEGEFLPLTLGFKNLVGCKFKIPPGMLTSGAIGDYLYKINLPEPLKKDLLSVFSEIEACQYSAGQIAPEKTTVIMEKMENIAQTLEGIK